MLVIFFPQLNTFGFNLSAMNKVFFTSVFCFTFLFIGYSQHLMPVYYATSSQRSQGGQEIENAFDGNDATDYHTYWYGVGIPDTLTFYFPSIVSGVNALEYTPRQEGYNGIWSLVELQYSLRSVPDSFLKYSMDDVIWAVDHQKKSISFDSTIHNIYAFRIIVKEAYENFSSCAELRFWNDEPLLSDGSKDCDIVMEGVPDGKDIRLGVDVDASSASSYQVFENIGNSVDGDFSTLYHSSYDGGPDEFPIELIYHFNANTSMDYFIYYPRNDGNNNGNFGKTQIFYNTTSNPDYVHLIDHNFSLSGLPAKVSFPTITDVNNLKIVIDNGANDFASCSEIEFYSNNQAGNSVYLDIFKNELYAELLPSVTQSQIDTITSPFFQTLAQCIFNQNYNQSLRVRDFHAFESIQHLGARLKTSAYDSFENATGIAFDKGQTAIIAMDGIGDQSVYLRVRNWANEASQADHLYFLKDGLNNIEMKDSGLAYISFYSDTPETARAVKSNIMTGKCNGYFDPAIHSNDDWTSIMTNQAYPKVDIIGKYAHLVYDKSPLRFNSPFDGFHLIEMYDSIVNWQKIQMGLYKYGYKYNNHILAICETGGGYYAGGEGVHFDWTWGAESIANPNRLGLWGIAHEFGHVNQIRPGLRWIGTVEVTNNIFSLWADYNLNKENKRFTRLEEEAFANGNGTQSWSGNRFNLSIDSTYIHGRALQDVRYDYPFRVLIPFWQLELYYQLAGACRNAPLLTYEENPPSVGVDYAHWYGYVAEKARTLTRPDMSNGELLLNFVKYTCEAVQEDLTDFFINTGFLRPIDKDIEDYWVDRLTVTQEQIDELILYIKSNFPNKPVSPVIQYISAHSKDMFLNRLPLSGETGKGVKLISDEEAPFLYIDHSEWKNAVAYETYDSTGQLVHVTITGTDDVSNQTTSVLYRTGDYQVYAVGFDGSRILVYPKEIINGKQEVQKLKVSISPNPTSARQGIQLSVKDAVGEYQCCIYNSAGNESFNGKGEVSVLNQRLKNISHFLPGTYFIRLSKGKETFATHFIVQ